MERGLGKLARSLNICHLQLGNMKMFSPTLVPVMTFTDSALCVTTNVLSSEELMTAPQVRNLVDKTGYNNVMLTLDMMTSSSFVLDWCDKPTHLHPLFSGNDNTPYSDPFDLFYVAGTLPKGTLQGHIFWRCTLSIREHAWDVTLPTFHTMCHELYFIAKRIQLQFWLPLGNAFRSLLIGTVQKSKSSFWTPFLHIRRVLVWTSCRRSYIRHIHIFILDHITVARLTTYSPRRGSLSIWKLINKRSHIPN